MKEAGKDIQPLPYTALAVISAVAPVWAVTVLPLSILYQGGRMLFFATTSQRKTTGMTVSLDSGYKVEESQVIPRSQRRYDVVILGATGFTGRLAVRHVAQTYHHNRTTTMGQSPAATIKWAIAGRSADKLEAVKRDVGFELGVDLSDVDTIVVDTSIPATLPKLVEQTRVVATTAGPYNLYGSHVVEFCAKFGTHYVDITGETEWVKVMLDRWQTTAQRTGARIIPFCGHDSIPWDLTVHHLRDMLAKECQDQLQSVSCWNFAIGAAPGGTFASIVEVLVKGRGVSPSKDGIPPFQRLPDGSASAYTIKGDLPLLPAPATTPFTQPGVWMIPYIMSGVNKCVVGWSHALRAQGCRVLTYHESQIYPDWKTAIVNYLPLVMLGSLFGNPITLYLLQKFVIPSPGQGPPMHDMEHKFFLCVKALGRGEQGHCAESVMYFPRDAGCLETSRMLVESGLCLALQEEQLPVKQGGFWSPAVGLGDVLLQRLIKTGTVFTSQTIPKPNQ